MIKTLILPVGPPGSGKSTLTNGLQQFMTAISRPCSVANLDPANDVVPYVPAFDVRELVSVEEVMEREELGPNGGVLWAMEEIEANLEWLEERLAECEDTVVLDPPGQPELTIHHMALPRILQRLEKMGYRIVVLQLLDSVVLTRPSLYLSSLLLCVRGMLHLPYPIVNILTKIDNLKALGGADLPFNLDFYTEVQDLTYLLPELSREQSSTAAGGSNKWEKLNEALVDLVQDFGLVGFETLAVEDRASMFSLLKAIDRASGYLLSTTRNVDPSTGGTVDDEASVWAQAMSENWTGKMDVRDVQERWVGERREEWDELERKGWEEEARLAGALPGQSSAEAVRKHARERGAEWVDDEGEEEEDEALRAQREWEDRRRRDPGGDGGGGTKAVRKG
ncbi:putative ATP binding protein [Hortaea werneckii]|uniref:GPN-loop GTPase 2 n=1 Tax=Hortaea werneckii TaxID=91943 RepID=A0A3M7I205_HORWE|nr:putative ATP binding protein [Hortaea werneckii]KAI6820304.1 putative ATP binding protein [Hortaea werneckii]KAI6922922.1 putative ATP binding protein [Hortaea werneckii]KAI6932060.1 putative ATP binding protein [Hortaea werneckii]KAI6980418.1 putative ATP binding protein [Hortaea werneckii]